MPNVLEHYHTGSSRTIFVIQNNDSQRSHPARLRCDPTNSFGADAEFRRDPERPCRGWQLLLRERERVRNHAGENALSARLRFFKRAWRLFWHQRKVVRSIHRESDSAQNAAGSNSTIPLDMRSLHAGYASSLD